MKQRRDFTSTVEPERETPNNVGDGGMQLYSVSILLMIKWQTNTLRLSLQHFIPSVLGTQGLGSRIWFVY